MADDGRSPLLDKQEKEGVRIRNRHDLPAEGHWVSQLAKESCIESKRLWYIAGPAIFAAICQYSLGAITQTFAGQLGTVELAAVAIQNAVIAGLAYGTMLGMGSALGTLCGQAFGAGQLHMLGLYMQRSWIILNGTALVLILVYVFSPIILKLFGQSDEISHLAGKFAIWMLPQLFACAINFPIQKFLQSQSKVMAMAWTSAIALVLHIFLSWLCIMKLRWGLVGAAVALNLSWWVVVLGQLVYILCGSCPGAWNGFSWLAFKDLVGFVRLSLASALMLCLEYWYLMILIILSGNLKNPEIAVDAISICMTLNGWEAMIILGFNAAISVRVGNELGAGRPDAAKFAIVIVTLTSLTSGIASMVIVFVTKDYFPVLFTNSQVVMHAVSKLATLLALTMLLTSVQSVLSLLALTMLLTSVQSVLSGVAVGAGWQRLVAYVNVGCYYGFGLPSGILLGYTFKLGIKGIWSGIMSGTVLQAFILLFITCKTDWNREASEAGGRIRTWGGSVEVNKDSSSQSDPVPAP